MNEPCEANRCRVPHRFKVGDTVFVRDKSRSQHGYRIVEAAVREVHHHEGRHPGYPYGEGYALDGQLWWDCYPGCRVFATRGAALRARLSKPGVPQDDVLQALARDIRDGVIR